MACSNDETCCRTYGSSDDEYACCAFPDVCFPLLTYVIVHLILSIGSML